MKSIFSSILLFVCFQNLSFAQTNAVNFTCSDCHAIPHDLFAELDSGQVVVLVWVMPCPGCVIGAQTADSVVKDFQTSHPGEVVLYIADDYANTSCLNLGTWVTNCGITNYTPFSNAAINMADYGGAGMPKVVVFGGNQHQIFYNENGSSITKFGIDSAVSLAFSSINSIQEKNNSSENKLSIFPNPSDKTFTLKLENFTANYSKKQKIVLKNILGQEVLTIFEGNISSTQKEIIVNTNNLPSGEYFIEYIDNKEFKPIKISIIN